jgi:hypothetical protein
LPLLLDALQAPFQKINLQRLLTDLAFQLRHTVRLRPAPIPETPSLARVEIPLANGAVSPDSPPERVPTPPPIRPAAAAVPP